MLRGIFSEPRPDLQGTLERELKKEVVTLLAANKWPCRHTCNFDAKNHTVSTSNEEVQTERCPSAGCSGSLTMETISDRNLERFKDLGRWPSRSATRMAYQGSISSTRYGKAASLSHAPFAK